MYKSLARECKKKKKKGKKNSNNYCKDFYDVSYYLKSLKNETYSKPLSDKKKKKRKVS